MYLFAVKRDGFIYMSGRDMTYFPASVRHLVVTEDVLLNSGKDRLLQIYNKNADFPKADFSDDAEASEFVAKLLTNFKLEDIPMAKRNPKNDNGADSGADPATGADPVQGAVSQETAKSRGSRIPKTAVIHLKTDKNPKREGSAAHGRFALYKDGMTVGEFLEAGGTMGDINFDAGKEFIALEGADAPEPAEATDAAASGSDPAAAEGDSAAAE